MSDSDIEIKRIPPMKPAKKPPSSPTEHLLKAHQEKKTTTKAMIHEALTELKTRKGVSIQAIKKFMEDKYYVETDKVKYLIKKTLKTGVEDGSIVQLKGIGASGSFKLAAVKGKPKKKPTSNKEKPKKEKSTKEKSKEKPKEKKEKTVKERAIDKMKTAKKIKMDVNDKEKKIQKPKEKKIEKPQEKIEKPKEKKIEKSKEKKKAESKEKVKAKTAATPSKKRAAMMKRKSIHGEKKYCSN